MTDATKRLTELIHQKYLKWEKFGKSGAFSQYLAEGVIKAGWRDDCPRVSAEKLCQLMCYELGKEMGETGKNIYEDYPNHFNEVMPRIAKAIAAKLEGGG